MHRQTRECCNNPLPVNPPYYVPEYPIRQDMTMRPCLYSSLPALLMLMLAGCTGEADHASLQSAQPASADSSATDSIAQDIGSAAAANDLPRSTLRPDFAGYFEKQNADGCFVLYNLNADSTIRYNPTRCAQGFLPASTFKIFNSLVALETGVLADETMVLPWDGVKRTIKEWNQDQSMRTAFRYSAVWFYQEVARRIGEKRMAYYINREGYGNRDIGGGIDMFWLSGDLRITADEQIEFLKRLYTGQLGFSDRTMAIVKDIMTLEQTETYTLRGKTGWATDKDSNLGWLVGYLEQNGNVYVFATNLTAQGDTYPMVSARMDITKGILKELGLM